MNDYQFGNHLYQLRHQAGYTQKEVADHCGVSNKAVSKWENGKTKPGVQIIRKLAGIIPHLRRSAAHGDRHEERQKDHGDRAHRRALRGQDHRDELDSECVH